MNAASSELSLTAIAVVAIAAIGVLFTTVVWPSIKSNITNRSRCANAVSCENCNGKTCDCYYFDDSGEVSNNTIKCPDSEAN